MRKFLSTLVLIAALAACVPLTPLGPEPIIVDEPVATLPPAPTSEPTQPPIPNQLPPESMPALFAARRGLANALAIGFDDIEAVYVELNEWPDGCLGAGQPDEMCTQALVMGYRILLNVGPVQYEFRTNADGSILRWIGQPVILEETNNAVFTWQSADCTIYSATTTQASFGKCGEALTLSTNTLPENLAIVSTWVKRFKSFDAETPAGKVTFTGQGDSVATKSEQRMMAEWAALMTDVALSGRAGAAWGLAFSWSREGGFAGFCDNVAVYRNGLVVSWTCGSNGVNYRLNASQLDQLYGLLDSFSTIDYEYKDPAVADAMSIRLTFAGNGAQTAREPDIAAINQFAAELAALSQANQSNDASIEEAQYVLNDFFAALNGGDYIKSAKLYGGDTALLATWNPDITDDLPRWLERACTQNGLQCLALRASTYRGLDARGGHQFIVEFNHADGTLFYQGDISSFIFAVVKQENGLWLVMDLPPYVP